MKEGDIYTIFIEIQSNPVITTSVFTATSI